MLTIGGRKWQSRILKNNLKCRARLGNRSGVFFVYECETVAVLLKNVDYDYQSYQGKAKFPKKLVVEISPFSTAWNGSVKPQPLTQLLISYSER